MMIEVNHQFLRELAAAMDSCCDTQDREMRSADGEVKSLLSSGWTGQDAQAFGGKWEGVDASDSTAIKLRKNMKDLAEALRSCAGAYETAQADSYNSACRLPRW